MHVMSVEYLRPMMGASPSSDQLQQQLSQNTRGHCRPSTREGGKGGAHRARALSAAARGPHLSTRNPRPKESARPGGQEMAMLAVIVALILILLTSVGIVIID